MPFAKPVEHDGMFDRSAQRGIEDRAEEMELGDWRVPSDALISYQCSPPSPAYS